MPRFITIGYGDEAGYERTPQPLRDAAHAYDAELQKEAPISGIAGKPVQVRNPEGKGVTTTAGAFLSSPLPIAGFAVIEAETIEEAIAKVAQTPCAIAHGVVEVWPLETTPK